MNDTELFELCKEVYEKTGWKDTVQLFDPWGQPVSSMKLGGETPIYTSDYLLEKLPVHIDEGVRAQHLLVYAETIYPYTENYYTALYEKSEYQEYSDTPLKALLKLTIALHEAKAI